MGVIGDSIRDREIISSLLDGNYPGDHAPLVFPPTQKEILQGKYASVSKNL